MTEPLERKKEVGDLLFEQGRISDRHLEAIRRRQLRLHISQHAAVLDLNCASEEDTYRALAALHQVEFIDLATFSFPPGLLESIPVRVMFNHRVIPVAADDDGLTLAFCDPPRQSDLANLRLLLGKKLKVVLSTPSGFRLVIKRQFGLGAETLQKLREDRASADPAQEVVFDVKTGEEGAAVDASIANFVDQMLGDALRLQATDVHLEPYAADVKLRYRVDGILQAVSVPADLRRFYPALVSRLKIMAGLNISEKRVAQDGRITMKTEREEYDLRASIIPGKHGEGVCLRILGRQNLLLEFSDLGVEPGQEALLKELTQLPQGLVLITGPTGSGKTTTLYAALAHANDRQRKIITIEDPVEYQLEGIMQIQTRDEVGLTFATGLRSVLRHDPDVVLIGEIRDAETAEIAVRAAQTGHLVFSTLHTNDSVSALPRLLDMGIDPFLVGASLVCSVAQRLAQRICLHCREPDPELSETARQEMAAVLKIEPAQVRACRGRGCVECGQKGYRGRVGLYEFFVVTDDIADLLGMQIKTGQLRAAARQHGWRPLRENGWAKVQAGQIPAIEVQRLTRRLKQPGLDPEFGAA